MAKTRRAFVHVGVAGGNGGDAGHVVDRATHAHIHALLDLGVKVPAKSREEMLRAAADLTGEHRTWNYDADEVSGTWARVCRRAAKGRDTVLISQPLLADAEPDAVEQVRVGLTETAGLEVHVLITAHAPDAWTVLHDPAHDLAAVVERWRPAVRSPQHLHVLIEHDPAEAWRRVGRVVGFGTASLRLEQPGLGQPAPLGALPADVLTKLGAEWAELLLAADVDLVGDPEDLVPDDVAVPDFDPVSTEQALADTRRELDLLRRHNEALTLRLSALERKRAKLKRRLAEAS